MKNVLFSLSIVGALFASSAFAEKTCEVVKGKAEAGVTTEEACQKAAMSAAHCKAGVTEVAYTFDGKAGKAHCAPAAAATAPAATEKK